MIGAVLGVTPAQLNALRAAPPLVHHLVVVVRDNQLKAQIAELIKSAPPERWAQLEANQARFEQSPAGREVGARAAEARREIAALGAVENVLSLEKSWHMLHYLFTGHVEPANAPGDLLLTGEEVGEDLGYGPARLHDETQTREHSRFLDGQDLARLQARIDPKEMNTLGIYAIPRGPGPDAEYENELREDVALYFPRLRDYVREMADKGNGLLVWIA